MALGNMFQKHSQILHPGSKGKKNASHSFHIELDKPFVEYRGAPGETGPVKLTGRVILDTSETVQTKGVRIVFEGKRRTSHFFDKARNPSATSPPIVNKTRFLRKEIELVESSGQLPRVLAPGSHEFQFHFELESDLPETVEGLSGTNILYDLQAVVDRGKFNKDFTTDRRVRVIRTFRSGDPSELQDPHDVLDSWPDKLKYSVHVPNKTVVFGSSVIASMELTPLLDKLAIGEIRVRVEETRRIKTVPGPSPDDDYNTRGMWKKEYDVVRHLAHIPPGSESTDSELQLPSFKFDVVTPLPSSLGDARQTVEHNEWIHIKHRVHYEIMLINPDGHSSSLKLHHDLKILISPYRPVRDDNTVAEPPQAQERAANDTRLLNTMLAAPPTYNDASHDVLFVDGSSTSGPGSGPGSGTVSGTPSGYVTPAGPWAGVQTPHRRAALSRRGSAEYVGPLSALSTMPQPMTAAHDGVGPSALVLEHHLSSIQQQREGLQAPAGLRGTLANPMVFSPGGEDEHPPVRHVEFDMEALERMPSYGTAVRTRANSGYLGDAPPDYGTATSQPPSPSASRRPSEY